MLTYYKSFIALHELSYKFMGMKPKISILIHVYNKMGKLETILK